MDFFVKRNKNFVKCADHMHFGLPADGIWMVKGNGREGISSASKIANFSEANMVKEISQVKICDDIILTSIINYLKENKLDYGDFPKNIKHANKIAKRIVDDILIADRKQNTYKRKLLIEKT